MDLTHEDSTSTFPRAVELTAEVRDALNGISVETVVHQLQKRGITNSYLTGLQPLTKGQRLLGYARTLRFLPLREDQQAALLTRENAQRVAVEQARPGDVLVIDARGVPDAGTLGDLLVLRLIRRGAVGVITDGAIRDASAIARLGLACYQQSFHAATFGRRHLPFEVNRPVACAGTLVMPDDIMIGDDGGCAVIPAALAAEVARDAQQQELEEVWAAEQIARGDSTLGTFPLSPARRPDFDTWVAKRQPHPPVTP